MKTQTSNWNKKLWALWTVLIALSVMTTACNKKDSNNNANNGIYYDQFGNPISPGGIGSCMNCNFAQGPLGTAQSQGGNSYPATITWNMIGDQNIIAQITAQGWNPQKTYTGPIALTGTMTMSQATYAGNCSIPAGQYTLNSMQAGTMSYGGISQVQLQAVIGGAQITFSLENAVVIDSNADGQIERIAGQLRALMGPSAYGTGYPTAQPYPNPGYGGGMVSCGDYGAYLQ